MLFNSLTFLAFFAIVLALHVAPLPWRLKKFNLLLASYLFYAAWNPPFVILLWISTAVDWWAAGRIHRTQGPMQRRGLLLISLIANLGLLGYFKYGGFITANFVQAMASVGIVWPEAPAWDIVLPVGISFYTFQTMAYTLDVYLRRAPPAKSFLASAAWPSPASAATVSGATPCARLNSCSASATSPCSSRSRASQISTGRVSDLIASARRSAAADASVCPRVL